eukprot:m.263269 g.263269  ORF g.263269 m.263269 type:complete len:106 (+) comp49647_c0_seq1:18-335(+)
MASSVRGVFRLSMTLQQGRVPMIKFPARKTPEGSALETLSLDFFNSQAVTTAASVAPSTQNMSTAAVSMFASKQHHPLALERAPDRFRRKPYTESEIESVERGTL